MTGYEWLKANDPHHEDTVFIRFNEPHKNKHWSWRNRQTARVTWDKPDRWAKQADQMHEMLAVCLDIRQEKREAQKERRKALKAERRALKKR